MKGNIKMTHEFIIDTCNYILQDIKINLSLEKAALIKEVLKIWYNKNCKIEYHNYDDIIISGNAKINHIGNIETVYHNLKKIKSKISSIKCKNNYQTGYYIKLL